MRIPRALSYYINDLPKRHGFHGNTANIREKLVDHGIYKNYIGRYQLAPGAIFTVTLDGDHLMTQLTGQQPIEIFPESEWIFFLKLVDAQVTFEPDGKGPANAIALHQNGRETRGTRVSD